ncbi:MAG: hypothetical protein QM765_35325 [Myxococcales bacterium]
MTMNVRSRSGAVRTVKPLRSPTWNCSERGVGSTGAETVESGAAAVRREQARSRAAFIVFSE